MVCCCGAYFFYNPLCRDGCNVETTVAEIGTRATTTLLGRSRGLAREKIERMVRCSRPWRSFLSASPFFCVCLLFIVSQQCFSRIQFVLKKKGFTDPMLWGACPGELGSNMLPMVWKTGNRVSECLRSSLPPVVSIIPGLPPYLRRRREQVLKNLFSVTVARTTEGEYSVG